MPSPNVEVTACGNDALRLVKGTTDVKAKLSNEGASVSHLVPPSGTCYIAARVSLRLIVPAHSRNALNFEVCAEQIVLFKPNFHNDSGWSFSS